LPPVAAAEVAAEESRDGPAAAGGSFPALPPAGAERDGYDEHRADLSHLDLHLSRN
jgi:hypothetical protein